MEIGELDGRQDATGAMNGGSCANPPAKTNQGLLVFQLSLLMDVSFWEPTMKLEMLISHPASDNLISQPWCIISTLQTQRSH